MCARGRIGGSCAFGRTRRGRLTKEGGREGEGTEGLYFSISSRQSPPCIASHHSADA